MRKLEPAHLCAVPRFAVVVYFPCSASLHGKYDRRVPNMRKLALVCKWSRACSSWLPIDWLAPSGPSRIGRLATSAFFLDTRVDEPLNQWANGNATCIFPVKPESVVGLGWNRCPVIALSSRYFPKILVSIAFLVFLAAPWKIWMKSCLIGQNDHSLVQLTDGACLAVEYCHACVISLD